MPYDTDESYFILPQGAAGANNEPGALGQEEAEALEWERHHRVVICPWELPGSDVPLTRAQMAIFTPDLLDPEEASAS